MYMTKPVTVGCLLIVVLILALSPARGQTTVPGPADPTTDKEIAGDLQALLDSVIDVDHEDPIHNVVLLVQCPRITWKGAAGMADGTDEAMTADHKFKIASIAKTFGVQSAFFPAP